MIVYLNDGIIAAMPDDPVSGGYNQNEVFTSEAPPRQYYGKMTVTSPCSYGENNVLKQAASPPLAYQVSPPLAYEALWLYFLCVGKPKGFMLHKSLPVALDPIFFCGASN